MAIVLAEPAADPESWSGSFNSLYQRFYTREFRVETDSRYDGPATLRLATTGSPPVPLIPFVGNSYFVTSAEKDLGSFVNNVTYSIKAFTPTGIEWRVRVEYGPYDASVFGANPLDWPVLISFGAAKYERIVTVDQAGNPVVNSAGEPFKDPIVIDDSRSVITVVRNEAVAGFDLTVAETYRDKVNDAAWNGFATKTVKCTSITTSEQQYDSNSQTYYFKVTYTFEVARDTWVKHLLDQGYNVLDSGTPPKLKPLLENGQKIDEPRLLDGSGHELASGGTPVFKDFDAYPSADFSAFSIDLSHALGR